MNSPPRSVVVPERLTGKIRLSPSVRCQRTDTYFPECPYPAVLLPERFRGGCSFGADTNFRTHLSHRGQRCIKRITEANALTQKVNTGGSALFPLGPIEGQFLLRQFKADINSKGIRQHAAAQRYVQIERIFKENGLAVRKRRHGLKHLST